MGVGTAVASDPKPTVTLRACLPHGFPPTLLPPITIKCVSIPGMHTWTLSSRTRDFALVSTLRICEAPAGVSHPDSSGKAVVSGNVRNGLLLLLILGFQLAWASRV